MKFKRLNSNVSYGVGEVMTTVYNNELYLKREIRKLKWNMFAGSMCLLALYYLIENNNKQA